MAKVWWQTGLHTIHITQIIADHNNKRMTKSGSRPT